MADPAFAIQKAIFDALNGATDAGASVFDTVPSTDPFPRITFGPVQSVPVDEQADPECLYDPTEVTQELNVWSIKTAFPEAKSIASQVRDVLHGATLDLPGFRMELPLRMRSADAFRDPDGKTRRVRMLFETRTAPVDSG